MVDTTPDNYLAKCQSEFTLFYFEASTMAAYSMMENELLYDAWLVRSADFVGMKQGGTMFSQNVHSWFHDQKHFAPYNLHMIDEHNVKSLAHL
jgi:hypothetical protein